jgi:hypothetical protein
MKLAKMLMCVAVLTMLVSSLQAQTGRELKRQAQNKLLAYRAARVDAIRNLAEQINGLMISAETTVKDFVTESDEINTEMVAFINGMREKGKPKYMEDGTCEVVMEVTVREVIANLKKAYTANYKGNKVHVNDFEKMEITYKDKILTARGMGAPRSEEWEKGTDGMVTVTEETLTSISHMSSEAKAFWMKYCKPQGRLMAIRAARVDGLRRLAERIAGVRIDSQTTVRDFVAESDDINVDMRAFIQGARETGIYYHPDELIVEVEMTVTLRTVYASLKSWGQTHYKGNKVMIEKIEKLTISSEDKEITETGMGVPPEKYLTDAPVEMIAVSNFGANAPDWASQTLRAVGHAAIDTENSNAAQAKLMAFRGAELDARRKLAEELTGLMITSETSVRDFVTENDQIRTAMLTYQQGASVVDGSEKVMEDGTVEVTVEIDLRPFWDLIVFYRK